MRNILYLNNTKPQYNCPVEEIAFDKNEYESLITLVKECDGYITIREDKYQIVCSGNALILGLLHAIKEDWFELDNTNAELLAELLRKKGYQVS